MLRSVLEMKNYTIGATDGEIGHVTDFFFDDRAWVIRYLVVETGSWLQSRKVLLSPQAILEADWTHQRLPVRITRSQVKECPDVDTQRPVSRHYEMRYAEYYGYPYYWGRDGLWPSSSSPPDERAPRTEGQESEQHLRSCNAITGYHLLARDGEIGHVQGILVEEDSWAIRYLVVDTSNWWLGHKVLIAPEWSTDISWEQAKLSVDLSRQVIQNSPPFSSTEALNRQHEMELFRHYDLPNYWEKDLQRQRRQEDKVSQY